MISNQKCSLPHNHGFSEGIESRGINLILRILNLVLLLGIIGSSVYISNKNGIQSGREYLKSFELAFQHYGWFGILLHVMQYLILLALPQTLFNFFGFIFYNSFPNNPKLKLPLVVPFLCFRVVTRGDFPELVQRNIDRNISTCFSAGISSFVFEVVTDKSICLPQSPYKREIIVPPSYQTKSGALYKARALQYCLEDSVNVLEDKDWIVHLDEETILTIGSIQGILKFISKGKHQFGQGVITYANEDIVNLFLTLCDTVRVAEDMGKIQFQLRALHMPLLGWKGSFVVAEVSAEKRVSFDNGPDGSVAEDTYMGILASSQGFSFDFIHGEMWEKSPFNISDFLRQRKRWLQGLLLVVHSSKIPLRYRILLALSIYSWVTLPVTTANTFLNIIFPVEIPKFLEVCAAFIGGMWMYLYVYGTCRSFSLRRYGLFRFILLLLAGILVTPFKVLVETAAVIWGLVTPKHNFFVVKKDIFPVEIV